MGFARFEWCRTARAMIRRRSSAIPRGNSNKRSQCRARCLAAVTGKRPADQLGVVHVRMCGTSDRARRSASRRRAVGRQLLDARSGRHKRRTAVRHSLDNSWDNPTGTKYAIVRTQPPLLDQREMAAEVIEQ